jgi:type II secretory pathway pseudopilin PulG
MPLAMPHRAVPAHVRCEQGMSLIEATIILMILFLLTAVMSPAIGDYVEDARQTKGKEDVELLGISVLRLQRDIGGCLKLLATTACTKANRVDLLRSSGPDVVAGDLGTSAIDFANDDIDPNPINWDDDQLANVGDTLVNQLVSNNPNYDTPAETTPTGFTLSGPQSGLGWRGVYISPPIGTDPWGKVYLINTAFLVVATDATDGEAEGDRRGGWSHDTFVISAGPNGLFDIPFGGNTNFGITPSGDDLIYVIRGDTR